jgi:hypothetical protein
MNVIELADKAKAEVITTTEQDGFESPEYVVTVWAFDQHQLQTFADLIIEHENTMLIGESEELKSELLKCNKCNISASGNKAEIFTMADLTNSNPLTLTERKMLVMGVMSILLEEDDRLSNLGMLLSKYEETIRAQELLVAELEHAVVSTAVNKQEFNDIQAKFAIAVEALEHYAHFTEDGAVNTAAGALIKIKGV